MGTNYFAISNKPQVHNNKIHIGKASYGWKFLLHYCDEFKSMDELNTFFDEHVRNGEYVIMDEYENVIPPDEMLEYIESKQDTHNVDNFKHVMNINGYRFSEGEFR